MEEALGVTLKTLTGSTSLPDEEAKELELQP
jgi:hypothetical protein